MAKRAKKRRPSREAISGRKPGAAPGLTSPLWSSRWLKILQALVIAAAVGWIYGPVLHGGWLWDDNFYVTENPLLRDPHRLWKTWFAPGSVVNYFPIESTFQWAQWELWGNDTFGYHVTNVVLHLLGSLLVWRLLAKFGLRLAWIGGLLFAVHPTAVESVAWIAELKNTLSLPPFIMAMCCWIDYEERRRRQDYVLALVWFLVAMLCKSTMVAFPLVILFYAWWRRGRLGWSDLRAATPFLIISVGLGLLNIAMLDWFQQNHQQAPDIIPIGGFLSRLAGEGLSLSFYLAAALWPVGLLPMYPQWRIDPPSVWQFLPWPVLGAAIFWCWRNRAGWGRHALLGLGFFFLNLAPFAGFITNSFMRFTWVMDHFLYIALIGLIGLVVAAMSKVEARLPRAALPAGVALLAGAIVFLAWESHRYAGRFISQETLWTYTLQHNPGAYLADNNLGDFLVRQGRTSEAILPLEASVRLNPNFTEAHYNLGCAYSLAGRSEDAARQFGFTVRMEPRFSMAYNAWGNVLIHEGHRAEAKALYQQALQIDPGYADAHNNLGNILTDEGHLPEALDQYDQALRTDPNFVTAHSGRGILLAKMGRLPESAAEFQSVLRLDPTNVAAQNNLDRIRKFQAGSSGGP